MTPWRRGVLIGLIGAVIAAAAWTWWAEQHPREERRLRVLVHDGLDAWFPEQMAPVEGWHGIYPRTTPAAPRGLSVLLVHGLDEPGTIWDDLVPRLDAAGFATWELRYPNDQGIDRDADYLAANWSELPAHRPVALIGHSMGGLVIRDFVSRLRYPVETRTQLGGAPVAGLILVGTPNRGSEWARLRVWLELRDQFSTYEGRRFSLFAGLRDGTGEAKIDLRPESDFLRDLNARSWPPAIPVVSIAGRLLGPATDFADGLNAASAEAGSSELRNGLFDWWSGIDAELGDGVVSLESAGVPGGPPPLVENVSHRGLLVRLLPGDPEPPAITPILDQLDRWEEEASTPRDGRPTSREERPLVHHGRT